MKISYYAKDKINYVNIYLENDENKDHYSSLIEELKKKYRVILFESGSDDLKTALWKGLSDT
jgi:hypothetical protein